MNVKRPAAMVLAVTMLLAGVVGPIAAAPGQAPDEAGEQADDDHGADDADRDAGNGTSASAANASNSDASASQAQGSTEAVPKQVPDHVAEIRSVIDSFLGGELEHLGAAVSGVTAGDAPTDESDEGGDDPTPSGENAETMDNETPTATPT